MSCSLQKLTCCDRRSFVDPKIPEVSLYISNFQRPITERISSGANFFNDPSFASVGCVKTTSGKVTVSDKVNKSTGGEEVRMRGVGWGFMKS